MAIECIRDFCVLKRSGVCHSFSTRSVSFSGKSPKVKKIVYHFLWPIQNVPEKEWKGIKSPRADFDCRLVFFFLYQENVSNFPSENIWDGSHGRLHALDGLPACRRQTLQVIFHFKTPEHIFLLRLGRKKKNAHSLPLNDLCHRISTNA